MHRSPALTGSVPAAYTALDHEGDLHVLIEARVPGPEDDTLLAVTLKHRPLILDKQETLLLDVAFHGTGLDDVAAQFAASILEEVWAEPLEPPAVAATRVLDRWRRFLETAPTWEVTPATLAPLVAELLVARDVVKVTSSAIHAWRGQGARHDFVGGSTAIEVKSTLAHTAYRATIHGVDQLEAPSGGRLLLEFIRLEATPGAGVTAPGLIDDLERAGVSRADLRSILSGPGLALVTSEAARGITFSVRERLMIPVGPEFPQIVNDSFVGGSPGTGIEDVHYRINLAETTDAALSAQGRASVVTDVAQGASLDS